MDQCRFLDKAVSTCCMMALLSAVPVDELRLILSRDAARGSLSLDADRRTILSVGLEDLLADHDRPIDLDLLRELSPPDHAVGGLISVALANIELCVRFSRLDLEKRSRSDDIDSLRCLLKVERKLCDLWRTSEPDDQLYFLRPISYFVGDGDSTLIDVSESLNFIVLSMELALFGTLLL